MKNENITIERKTPFLIINKEKEIQFRIGIESHDNSLEKSHHYVLKVGKTRKQVENADELYAKGVELIIKEIDEYERRKLRFLLGG